MRVKWLMRFPGNVEKAISLLIEWEEKQKAAGASAFSPASVPVAEESASLPPPAPLPSFSSDSPPGDAQLNGSEGLYCDLLLHQ
jgi:hypothetical protein